eukprot:TRINITY_DN4386_c0_g1_i1.p1 TRINITY_DN4386_c0_g1~~TRINITY_DN4386_c0_g1_i1.p1  ORF type:complete len:582 (+),score=91.34 TRINITY_DN4386_c0_g1_i1:244-1746(+)
MRLQEYTSTMRADHLSEEPEAKMEPDSRQPAAQKHTIAAASSGVSPSLTTTAVAAASVSRVAGTDGKAAVAPGATPAYASCTASPGGAPGKRLQPTGAGSPTKSCCRRLRRSREAATKARGAQGSRRDHGRFFRCLYDLLRQLPPSLRREVIARRLSGVQRARLEAWLLSQRRRRQPVSTSPLAKAGTPSSLLSRGPDASAEPPEKLKSLCRLVARDGRVGYRPILHLAGGLYAQAAFSFDFAASQRALGTLRAMRKLCRDALALAAMDCGAFDSCEECIATAVRQALSFDDPMAPHKFYFKVRMRGGGAELATPSRLDVDSALADRRRLLPSCGCRPEPQRLRRAWAALWAERLPRGGGMSRSTSQAPGAAPAAASAAAKSLASATCARCGSWSGTGCQNGMGGKMMGDTKLAAYGALLRRLDDLLRSEGGIATGMTATACRRALAGARSARPSRKRPIPWAEANVDPSIATSSRVGACDLGRRRRMQASVGAQAGSLL